MSNCDFYLQHEISGVKQQIANRQVEIAKYASLESKAKTADAQLESIKKLNTQKSHFSSLLNDLANVIPQGVSIQSLTLTGDIKQPVRISFAAVTYDEAVAFRDALATSPIISGADIENVSSNSTGSYTGAITVGFKPGALQ